ncbi:MAG: ABC transporter permease [Pseudobdellovibrio sp.]
MLFWKIAFRNVKINWRHSLSALLSISASFMSLVLFDGYIGNLKGMYKDSFEHRSMLGDFIIEKPQIHSKEGLAEPDKFLITEQEQQLIEDFLQRHKEFVSHRVRFVNFQGMITNGHQSAIVMGRGFDVTEGEKVRGANWSWNTTYGLPLHKSNTEYAALMGQGLARKMNCTWLKPKDFYSFRGGYEPLERPFDCATTNLQVSVMTDQGQLNAVDLNVVGLMDAGYRDIDDRYLITSIETAQTITNNKGVSMMSVQLNDGVNHDDFAKLFNDEIVSQHPDLKIMTWVEHPVGETYLKTLDLMAVFRNFVVIVILVISVLSVINTLIKIIKERSREIGTLRSIGFKARQVVRMFIYETLLLSFIGTVIGMLLSVVVTLLLNYFKIRYKAGMLSEPVLFKIDFSFVTYGNAFFILIFVSLMACVYSTRQEINKKIIENFNHV